jgi:hypothetical protein
MLRISKTGKDKGPAERILPFQLMERAIYYEIHIFLELLFDFVRLKLV